MPTKCSFEIRVCVSKMYAGFWNVDNLSVDNLGVGKLVVDNMKVDIETWYLTVTTALSWQTVYSAVTCSPFFYSLRREGQS
jgi:hypothetical protein